MSSVLLKISEIHHHPRPKIDLDSWNESSRLRREAHKLKVQGKALLKNLAQGLVFGVTCKALE